MVNRLSPLWRIIASCVALVAALLLVFSLVAGSTVILKNR